MPNTMTLQSSPTLPALLTELQQLLQTLQETAQTQLESTSEELKALKTKSAKLEGQILVAQDKLDSLFDEVDTTEANILTLSVANNDQKRKNDALIQEYATLSSKMTSIKQEILSSQNIEKAVREDLAIRIRAADERDNNIKLREQKVSQAEGRVQANTDLLGL